MRNRILYVEDEPSLARIVRESLLSRNFDVIHVADGSEVLETFIRQQPDLCILDIMLPGKDGYSIAREIKNSAGRVPIIFLSAKTQTKDVIQGFKSGGNDYLKKPFSMEELIARINNLLQLSSQFSNESTSYDIASYQFFPLRYELKNEESVIRLSHRESKLLEMLVSRKNDTCLRKDILLSIWGDDSYFNSRTLDVYINKLRKHFKADQRVKIVTLKGVGYLFEVNP